METKSLFAHYLEAHRKHFFDMRGRECRRAFWGYALFDAVVTLLLGVAGLFIFCPWEVFAAEESFPIDFYVYEVFLAIGLALMYNYATMTVRFGMTVRRLHDVGYSAWWVGGYVILALLTLVVGNLLLSLASASVAVTTFLIMMGLSLIWLITLIVLLAREGEPTENKWGENPKQAPLTSDN